MRLASNTQLSAHLTAALKHGEFIPWVEKNCPFTRRHAANFIRLAVKMDANGKSISHLTVTEALKLIAPAKAETEKKGKAKKMLVGEGNNAVPKEYRIPLRPLPILA